MIGFCGSFAQGPNKAFLPTSKLLLHVAVDDAKRANRVLVGRDRIALNPVGASELVEVDAWVLRFVDRREQKLSRSLLAI